MRKPAYEEGLKPAYKKGLKAAYKSGFIIAGKLEDEEAIQKVSATAEEDVLVEEPATEIESFDLLELTKEQWDQQFPEARDEVTRP